MESGQRKSQSEREAFKGNAAFKSCAVEAKRWDMS